MLPISKLVSYLGKHPVREILITKCPVTLWNWFHCGICLFIFNMGALRRNVLKKSNERKERSLNYEEATQPAKLEPGSAPKPQQPTQMMIS